MTWSWLPHLRMHGAGVDRTLGSLCGRCRSEVRIGNYLGLSRSLTVLVMAVMMIMVVVAMVIVTAIKLTMFMMIVMIVMIVRIMLIVAAMLSH